MSGAAADQSAKLWRGRLSELGETLLAEVRGEKWVWRNLRGGALVAARIDPETRRTQFRVARATRPTLKQRPMFEREAQVFGRHLGCDSWPCDIRNVTDGGIEAVWTAPDQGFQR